MWRKVHGILCREKFISCREKFTEFYAEKSLFHVEKSSRNFMQIKVYKSLFHVEKSSRNFMQRKVYFMWRKVHTLQGSKACTRGVPYVSPLVFSRRYCVIMVLARGIVLFYYYY